MNKYNLEKRISLKSIDSTFDRLRELQILLKKESALKELCKKTINKI
jgi:hypothetical protein